jgi:hypothetical protein
MVTQEKIDFHKTIFMQYTPGNRRVYLESPVAECAGKLATKETSTEHCHRSTQQQINRSAFDRQKYQSIETRSIEKKKLPGNYFVKGGKNKPQSKKRRKAHLKRFIKRRRA